MQPLRELQLRFAAALFDGDIAAIVDLIDVDAISAGIAPGERIGCYRNNLHAGFRKALALSFPVIERLVGETYFTQLAREYQRVHPSRSGNLHHIGREFAGFLGACLAGGEYNYLADVAELEWACQEIAVAAHGPSACVDDLRRVDPVHYESLPLALHPAVRLVASDFPIVRIWMSNQPTAAPETIDLNAGGEHVLVCERGDGLEFHRLRAAEYALATAAAEGMTLGEAAEQAIAGADESFDLVRALHRLLEARALVFPSLSSH